MSALRDRFQKEADESMQEYTSSLHFDRRLYRQDIAASIAHARMLARQRIISGEEAESIGQGLTSIREEIESGQFEFDTSLEDIHMNVEGRLYERIGDVAGKLHTARSRNDQVATAMRLYAKEAISETVTRLKDLQAALLDLAEANRAVILPGYTHLQRAQPVLLAHHLLAYFEMLQRDVERFGDCLERVDVLPLGSGALAGLPYQVDRDFVAKELGFSQISRNSMDAVSDRDFVIEYIAAGSMAMMHVSRLAEEIILWSSAEFGFIEIDDAYATTSSIMPQKKNPDVAELARGKTGSVYGDLMSILTTMKSLPLAYNRDLQDDKQSFFRTVDTVHSTLEIFTGMMRTIKVNSERTGQAAGESYTLATDVADYLVGKGMPFREAHGVVARLVRYAVEQERSLQDITLSEYRQFSSLFDEDLQSINVESSVAARDVPGGTAPRRVDEALREAREVINE